MISWRKLENNFILEELLVAVTSKKMNVLPRSATNTHTMLLCLVEKYFASIGCSCSSANKELICVFCSHLKENLNYQVKKVCIELSDKNDLPFQAIPLKKYLYDINVDFFLLFTSNMKIIKLWLIIQVKRLFFIRKLLIKKNEF